MAILIIVVDVMDIIKLWTMKFSKWFLTENIGRQNPSDCPRSLWNCSCNCYFWSLSRFWTFTVSVNNIFSQHVDIVVVHANSGLILLITDVPDILYNQPPWYPWYFGSPRSPILWITNIPPARHRCLCNCDKALHPPPSLQAAITVDDGPFYIFCFSTFMCVCGVFF